jgi:hypothetical protein
MPLSQWNKDRSVSRTYLNDQWVLDDRLGLGVAGDQVARMALQVAPPFSIGVTGKWGSGKTSVMRRAFVTLGGKPLQQAVPMGVPRREQVDPEEWDKLRFDAEGREPELDWEEGLKDAANWSLCVWYSPWQHQNADNPLVPLLLEIRDQFDALISPNAADYVRSAALAGMTLMERVVDAGISLMAGRPVKFVSGTTKEVSDAWNKGKDNLTQLSDGQRFHLLFEDAVEALLVNRAGFENRIEPENKARLIIFIDDLDRCEEQVVVQLLEAIKLYLGTRRCVFVFGMDDTAILGILRRHWTRSDDDNREYLEKLTQAMLPVPLPSGRQVVQLIEESYKAHKIPKAKDMAKLTEGLIEPNPRKIKNFVNSVCAAWGLYQPKNRRLGATAERFIMFQYLRLYHRSVWRLLERQPAALQVLQRVVNGRSVAGFPVVESQPASAGQEMLDADYALNDHRMVEQFISRAFSHVLGHDNPAPETDHLHRGQSLDQAVEAFQERLDRKRSDDYFIRWARRKLGQHEILEPEMLCINS